MAGDVVDADPFADQAFVLRLQKLLPLLASEQPGEADAARRKLLEHLGHHRQSLTDVAQRLGTGAARPSFTQGAREITLERQLHVARVARQEIEADAQRAMQRIVELQRAVQDATYEVARAYQSQVRLRLVAAMGWVATLVVGALTIAAHLHAQGVAQGEAIVNADRALLRQSSVGASEQTVTLGPGERFGTVLVQDSAVRMSPNDDAAVRAFLNRGMRVAVGQQVRVGVESWVLIRSVTGSGWVRGSDVLR